ncbi:hypothetical protein [Paraburkholderia tropica]|uniref:hypothetical protein n=1 Tax=Paraburkholderia tropica TaxID=92647 RepID=UPI0031E11397
MNFLELELPFETPRGIELPFSDGYGVPHANNYIPFLSASSVSLATRSAFSGVKIRRIHQALSGNEARAIHHMNFSPYVLDIREQYPTYLQEDYNRYKLAGTRMPRNKVMTYDIVLTMVLPDSIHGGYRLSYHGISIKDAEHVLSEADENRQIREHARFADRGWTWEFLRGDAFPKRAYGNHLLLKTWIDRPDIWPLYDIAKALAQRLKARSMRGTMDDVLSRHARHMGIALDDLYEIFAISVSFGFTRIDHSHELRVDKPLMLEVGS